MIKNKGAISVGFSFMILGAIALIVLVLVLGGGSKFFTKITNIVKGLPEGEGGGEKGDLGVIGYNLKDGGLYYFAGSEWELINGKELQAGKRKYDREETTLKFRNFIRGIGEFENTREGVVDKMRLFGFEFDARDELFEDQGDSFRAGMPVLGGLIIRMRGSYFLNEFGEKRGAEAIEGVVGGWSYISEGGTPEKTEDAGGEERKVAEFTYLLAGKELFIWRLDVEGNFIESGPEMVSSENWGDTETVRTIKELSENYANSVFNSGKEISLSYIEGGASGGGSYEVERKDNYVFVRLDE